MIFPLDKIILGTNSSAHEFLPSYEVHTEIPLAPHPGAFGVKRKHHCHEGIDLYCACQDEVFSMEEGMIVALGPFTGELVHSPWWNNTWFVMVRHASCCLNYGEITPLPWLKPGMKVAKGQLLGHVSTVLKKNKGRPMSMLHLEMYHGDMTQPTPGWPLNQCRPEGLLDPTELMLSFVQP